MSTQSRILNDLSHLIRQSGFEVEIEKNWANTGFLAIFKEGFSLVGSVDFNFQSSWKTMTFGITIGDKKVLSQPPRQGYYDFHMDYSATSEYKNFRSVLESELKKLTVSR